MALSSFNRSYAEVVAATLPRDDFSLRFAFRSASSSAFMADVGICAPEGASFSLASFFFNSFCKRTIVRRNDETFGVSSNAKGKG
jgi:hypothetical protein